MKNVDAYQAVVVGSAAYMGHWFESARTSIAQHAADLKVRRTWLFSNGPIGEPPLPTAEDAVHVDESMAATTARDHRPFAGKIDRQRLGFAERAVLRAVGAHEGDYRDWRAISDWADERHESPFHPRMHGVAMLSTEASGAGTTFRAGG